MHKTTFFSILILSVTFFLTFINLAYSKSDNFTGEEVIKEFETLKNKLGNMDIYVEPLEEGSLHIFRDYEAGKAIILKVVYDDEGNIFYSDRYFYLNEELIWEHREKNDTEGFNVIVKNDGTLIKEDYFVSALTEETPIPEKTSTPVPEITPPLTSMPTAVMTATPFKTPAPLTTILPVPSITPVSEAVFKERIIFSSDLNGTMDIYTMNTDGTNLHRITEDPGSELYPSISPDGRKIIFISDEDKNWNIFMINLDGTDKKKITDSADNDILPLFINDNTIIFQSFREGLPQIYKLDTGNKNTLERLTVDFTSARHPVFYPGREKFAFVGEKNGSFDIYSMDIAGKEIVQITHTGFEKAFPSIAQEGSKIAFGGNSSGYWHIYIVDPVKGEQKTIVTDFKDLYWPAFTSDSEWILFQAYDRYDYDIELYKINLNSGEILQLTDNKADDIHPRCQFISVP